MSFIFRNEQYHQSFWWFQGLLVTSISYHKQLLITRGPAISACQPAFVFIISSELQSTHSTGSVYVFQIFFFCWLYWYRNIKVNDLFNRRKEEAMVYGVLIIMKTFKALHGLFSYYNHKYWEGCFFLLFCCCCCSLVGNFPDDHPIDYKDSNNQISTNCQGNSSWWWVLTTWFNCTKSFLN